MVPNTGPSRATLPYSFPVMLSPSHVEPEPLGQLAIAAVESGEGEEEGVAISNNAAAVAVELPTLAVRVPPDPPNNHPASIPRPSRVHPVTAPAWVGRDRSRPPPPRTWARRAYTGASRRRKAARLARKGCTLAC